MYQWADGIHIGLRDDGRRLCVLVMIGVNARADKHFLAIEGGFASARRAGARCCWVCVCSSGFTPPAKLAVGDGALGFWSAQSLVYPETRGERCWMHKTG